MKKTFHGRYQPNHGFDREKSCTTKVRYPGPTAAKVAAHKTQKKYGFDVTPYACDYCLGYHLTSWLEGPHSKERKHG